MTELIFHLPFPLHGLSPRHENSRSFPWAVVAPDGAVVREALSTSVVIEHVQPVASPLMAAAGWQEHRTGEGATVTYSGDAHGGFSLTRWRVSIATRSLARLGFGGDPGIFFDLACLVNSFIDVHTAYTLTLWTPRATPRDIVDLRHTVRLPDGSERSGMMMSFANDEPIRAALLPLMGGPSPLVGEVQRRYDTPWGATILDGLRELMALRTVRAATLVALGFELFVNAVLLRCGKAAEAEKATLAKKGQELIAPLIGGALNDGVHGVHAEAWLRVLHGRNALMHRQQHAFTWKTLRQCDARTDVAQLDQCVEFIEAALVLIRYMEARSAQTPNLGEQ